MVLLSFFLTTAPDAEAISASSRIAHIICVSIAFISTTFFVFWLILKNLQQKHDRVEAIRQDNLNKRADLLKMYGDLMAKELDFEKENVVGMIKKKKEDNQEKSENKEKIDGKTFDELATRYRDAVKSDIGDLKERLSRLDNTSSTEQP